MIEDLQSLIRQYKYHFVAASILLSAIITFLNFPAENEYYRGADEGNYYRQGKILVNHGFAGFKIIADTYLNMPSLQDAPNPFRIGANTAVGMVLGVNDSFRAISFFCLLNFVLLLAGTFFFLDRYQGSVVAFFTVLLMAFSPLEMAMARRALMDMPTMTGMAFACFAFRLWTDTGRRQYLLMFIGFMVWSIFMKEVNVIFLPFFAFFLFYLKRTRQITIPRRDILICLIVPVMFTGVTYLAVFGYDNGLALFKTMYRAVSASAYSELYGQGPWYRILLDYTMLSPYVMLLSVFYVGYYLFQGKGNIHTDFMLLLSLFTLFSFSLLPKNVRYAIFFDLPLRFLAACGLVMLLSHLKIRHLKWLPIAVLLFLVFSDVRAFYDYFIKNAIYDPVSYNLLRANHIIPSFQP